MKKYSAVIMILVFSGLFLTSCEKEELLPSPGNTNNTTYPTLKAGEGNEDAIDDESDGEGSLNTITDGGRDEDFDKTRKKKVKTN